MRLILEILVWYGLFFVSGIIFWAAFGNFFNRLYDSGYAISKVLFFTIFSLSIWLISFVFKVMYDDQLVISIYVLLTIICALVIIYRKGEIPKVPLRKLLLVEIIFLFTTAFGLFVTSLHPAIDNTTERIMDFKLLNSLTSNSTLPGKDLWFAGENINYYYFGQFFFSLINKLTSTNVFNGYLLALGFIFGLASTTIFSIASSFRNKALYGIFAVILTMLFSNFDFMYRYITKYITINPSETLPLLFSTLALLFFITIIFSFVYVKKTKLIELSGIYLLLFVSYLFVFVVFNVHVPLTKFLGFIATPSTETLWFWGTSRVIPFTINEFPYYSLIVGDLHPHYIDLMFFPVQLTLILLEIKLLTPRLLNNFYKLNWKNIVHHAVFRKIVVIKFFSALIFSVGIATNSWELIFTGVLFFIKDLVYITRFLKYKLEREGSYKKFLFMCIFPLAFDALVTGIAVLLQLPFLRSISSPVSGIKFNSELSPLTEFSVLWGIFFFLSFIAFFHFGKKFIFSKIYLKSEIFAFILIITGLVLIVFSEFFFVADLFYYENFVYRRANTVFKVNYAGFIMFGLGLSLTTLNFFMSTKWENEMKHFGTYLASLSMTFVRVVIIVTIAFTLYYVPLSIGQWSGNVNQENRYSLDAETKTRNFNKDVFDAAAFLKNIRTDSDILIEAPGDAYKFESIGAVFSGMPNVIGWTTHEAQWRRYVEASKVEKSAPIFINREGNPTLGEKPVITAEQQMIDFIKQNVPKTVENRDKDVRSFFEFKDDWKQVLQKYKVTYVWVSDVEKTKFNSPKITELLNNPEFAEVYSNTTVKIYKVTLI